MMRLSFVKGALVPANEETRAALGGKYKVGDTIEIEIINPRRAAFNSKVHATLDEVAKMLGIDMLSLRAEILVETGRAQNLKLRNGKRVWLLPSMSKASMTQSELESFWDDARLYIQNHVMPTLPGEQQARVNNMISDGVPA